METYRIIPLGRVYRVEAVQPNGQTRVVRTWPTEEAAVSHLKALREVTERFGHALQPGEKVGAADVEAAPAMTGIVTAKRPRKRHYGEIVDDPADPPDYEAATERARQIIQRRLRSPD